MGRLKKKTRNYEQLLMAFQHPEVWCVLVYIIRTVRTLPPSSGADAGSYILHHISPPRLQEAKNNYTHTHTHSQLYKMMSAVKNYAVHHVLPGRVRL